MRDFKSYITEHEIIQLLKPLSPFKPTMEDKMAALVFLFTALTNSNKHKSKIVCTLIKVSHKTHLRPTLVDAFLCIVCFLRGVHIYIVQKHVSISN